MGLAAILLENGKPAEAEALTAEALALDDNNPGAQLTHGHALLAQGRNIAALAAYNRVTALAPGESVGQLYRGNALAALARKDEAIEAYERAGALEPGLVVAHYNRGCLLSEAGRLDEALAAYDRVLALEPGDAEAINNRGNVLRDLRRLEEALAEHDRALALKPGYAEAHANRGIDLRRLGRAAEAITAYDRALALKPGLAEVFYNRAIALGDLKHLAEALASCDRAVALNPGHAEAAGLAFDFAGKICDWGERDRRRADLIERVRRGERVEPFLMLGAIDDPEIHREAAAARAKRLLARPVERPRGAPHDRIRIAYVSADFREHPVARMIAAVIERHDRARFAVTGVALNPSDGSRARQRLDAAFDRMIDATRMPDRLVAARLEAEKIDIAIDLSGYTQNARPAIFAARAAPIQVNWFGYPGTMGAPFIDYILADPVVIPAAARHCYTEAIAILPDIYYANGAARPIAEAAPDRAEHGLPETGFVFSCFNAGQKLSPEMFERWMRLLRAVEGSVLWLYADNEWARANLAREAEARGIAAERLIFAPPADWHAHLARMRHADLFLDTLPYNAHTTASDALSAGLPLITVAGRSFAARVAASLLTAIGLPELIADSPESYEALALELARDPIRLGAVKAKLERNGMAGKLFDAARFCRTLEAAYVTMWERQESGQKPQGFAVPPEA